MQPWVNIPTSAQVTLDKLQHLRGQVGEQVVGEVIPSISGRAGGEANSEEEEPERFGGQHVEAGMLE